MFRKLTTAISEMKPAKRKLISDSIYGVAEGMAVIGVIAYGAKLTSIDLAIAIPAVGIWFGASLHTLYYKVQDYRREAAAEKAIEIGDEEAQLTRCVPIMRKSSHEIINSTLHASVSSLFIASDAVYLSGLVPASALTSSMPLLAVRTTASSLWLLISVISFSAALAIERREEVLHDGTVKLLGLNSQDVELVSEALFLAVGVLYAGAYSAAEVVNPVKVSALVLWIVAGGADVAGLIHDVVVRRKSESADQLASEIQRDSVEDGAVIDLTNIVLKQPDGLSAHSEVSMHSVVIEVDDQDDAVDKLRGSVEIDDVRKIFL